jgi:succinoglycan biosynthesis transport protein ExoP
MEIRLVNDLDPMSGGTPRQQYVLADGNAEAGGSSLTPGNFIRKYWLLLVLMIVFGAAAGFWSVVVSSPMYKARLLLEVKGVNEAWLKNSFEVAAFEANEVNIQTQINILRSTNFLKRGADRLQSETVPLAPTGTDLFSRLRQRIRPATRDPLESTRRGLAIAIATFDARPINRTRLIELICQSTSPDVAAQFLNSMAAEFLEDTSQSRMQTSQKTSEWLSAQIEETRSKMQDTEERLRDFVQASGNLFAGQETATLEDTKLNQAKLRLAELQSVRIAKQTRYELSLKGAPESLAEVQDNAVLRGYQHQISTLRREKAALQVTYTSKHEKVRRIDAQLEPLEKAYQQEFNAVVKRIRDDYEAALRQERLQAANYAALSQRVSAEAGKAAQYNALRREVETLRQMYQSLLIQQNQAGLSGSVPVSPIRIVEASSPPDAPYKPRPVLNISFGTILGIAITAGFAFLRERTDRSIRSPGITRGFLNTPELGVIPNLQLNGSLMAKFPLGSKHALGDGETISINGNSDHPVTALANWQNTPAFVAESFRGTLASILRNQGHRTTQKMILVTSAGPQEGKTTVVQNLGIALAETGRKILLVDADFRRPHLHKKFGVPNNWSLIDLISDQTPLTDYSPDRLALSTGIPGVSILPNRVLEKNVTKALYSSRLRTIFQMLRDKYDMVLVDAPPILHLADARIIAPLTDAVILVLRCGVTDRESAMEAYRRVQDDGLSLLGTVLTGWDASSSFRKRNYYYDNVGNDRT